MFGFGGFLFFFLNLGIVCWDFSTCWIFYGWQDGNRFLESKLPPCVKPNLAWVMENMALSPGTVKSWAGGSRRVTRAFFSAGTQGNTVPAPLALHVCNSKGCWDMLGDLIMIAAIIYRWKGLLFLVGDLLLLGGDCCWGDLLLLGDLLLREVSIVTGGERDLRLSEGSIVAGCWRVYWCWLLGDIFLLGRASIVFQMDFVFWMWMNVDVDEVDEVFWWGHLL